MTSTRTGNPGGRRNHTAADAPYPIGGPVRSSPALERIGAARRRRFAGRVAELNLFRSVVGSDGGAVVFVHGHGGVGKSSLLHQFADLGRAAGRQVIHLDPGEPAPDVPSVAGPPLLLIDDADTTATPERWLRDDVLARLPADAVVVLTGRTRPPLSWRVDPGWCDLVQVMPLADLDPRDARELLAARGVPDAAHGRMLEFARGHPLALALMADIHRQRGSVPSVPGPEIFTTLLTQLVDAVPSPAHRTALEACSQVRVLTEPLLAALLDVPDPHPLFTWLAGLAIVDLHPRGLVVHELARDVLTTELRWRNPDRHARLHRVAGDYYRQLFATADPVSQRGILLDLLHLHRDNHLLAPFLSGVRPGDPGAENLQLIGALPEHLPVLRELVRRYEGEESARIADHWFTRQPDAVTVALGPAGAVAGFAVTLALHRCTAADRSADPGAAAAWAYLRDQARLHPDAAADVLRFWIDAQAYQAPGPVQTLLSIDLVHRCLTTPALAYSLAYYADPEPWQEPCAYADFHRVPVADFTVGDRRYGAYGHDWRTVPPAAWLGLLADRETAPVPMAVIPQAAERPPPLPVYDEFAGAVRTALRDLGRADRLRDSPLLNCGIVAARAADATASGRTRALQEAVRAAAETLAASPRDRRAYRALHHTYLQPAGTQERAAELLGLPLSTFRRHLAAGITRLAEILWEQELETR